MKCNYCCLGAADVAVRQQLSSLLFVKKICEAKIRTLKYGDGELPSLPSVRMLYITVAVHVPLESDIYVYHSVFFKCFAVAIFGVYAVLIIFL